MGGVKDELGNTYGYLTVIQRGENTKEGRAQWICRCKCGKEIQVLGKSLRSGNTKSCGCLQKERAIASNMKRGGDLIGKRFGKLVVMEESGFVTHSSGKRSRVYKCKCDCGNICEVQHQYLNYGDTVSCGCIRSKGELQIATILRENNFIFKQEYSFADLKDILPLRFDFAIFNDKQELLGLIEFQGEQHTSKSNGYYSPDLIKHDKMKEEYCIKNNIPLIIIYYKKGYNLTINDLQLDKLKGVSEWNTEQNQSNNSPLEKV